VSVDIEAWAEGARGRLLAGKYRISELIGCGGMGAVFVAEDLTLGRQVAVKLMRPSRRGQSGVERFRREARAAARVGGDGIVQVLEFDFDGELGPFQVLELLAGESLSTRLKRGPMPPPEAIRLALDLVRTLERVHAAAIVHRDIKPANVFLEQTPEGHTRVKLLDFGIARMDERAELTVPGARVGTPGFMAPEQLQGREVGPPADIYALGILMHTSLVGEPPFAGMVAARVAAATLTGEIPTLLSRQTRLAAALVAIVDDASSFDMARRPNATALIARLSALHSAPVSVAARARSTPPPAARLASTLMSNPDAIPDTADPVLSPAQPAALSAPPARLYVPSTRTSVPARPTGGGWLYALGGAALLVMILGAFVGGWIYNERGSPPSPTIAAPPGVTAPLEPEASVPDGERPVPSAPTSASAPAPNEHLEAIRRRVDAGELALTAGQIEQAIRAFERARNHLSTLPAGAADRNVARSVYLGLGDAHLAAIERDAPSGAAASCQDRVAGHQVAAGTAYQELHMLGDADIAQVAQVRRGHLFERLGELCGTRNGSTRVRDAYLVAAEVEYDAAASADGPLRGFAGQGLARVRALLR